MTVALLAIDDLHAGYGRHEVLHGVSLPPLAAGTVMALLGPNGSGKSTLLKAVAGLLPSRGGLRLAGADLRALPRAERVTRLAHLPQALPAPVPLTVIESVLAALRAGAGGHRGDLARAEQVLAELGLQALALQPLAALSGGQRQLAGLAQALVRGPQVLLLDEPLSALDLRHQLITMRLLRGLAAQRGIAVLMVLHDLNIALRHCSAAALLQQGRLLAAGTPEETLTPARIEAAFGVKARIERCSLGHAAMFADEATAG
jgi:iron complex transport system ATP-binding protein